MSWMTFITGMNSCTIIDCIMWIIFALGAALLASFNPIISKRLLADTDVSVVAWAGQAFGLPLLTLNLILFFGPFPHVDVWFFVGILGSAILNTLAHLAATQALKEGEASLVAPLFVFSPAVTLLVSSFTLREIPQILPLVGVGLMILGAYLLALSSLNEIFEPLLAVAHQRALWLAITASVLWGITPVFEKTAIQHTFPENPTAAAFGALLALTLFLFPIMFRRANKPFAQIRVRLRGFMALGVIGGIAPLLGYAAFSLGLIGYVSALFKMSSVFALLWAFLFLQEKNVRRRLPGAVVMVIGAILIAG
jgi:uncharacterized membrane protein